MPTILIIEDSPTQAQELRFILEPEGFAVETVPTGEAGLARVTTRHFDLILSDIILPGLSGYEVCCRIKADPRTKAVPVVLLTVLSDLLDILHGLECGADNFLIKPYDPAFMVRRIQTILDNQSRRAERRGQAGISLSFRGRGITITSDKEQILDLLISTLEEFVRARERERDARVAKESLEKSQRFVQSALDALSTCVAILDGAGNVLAVNASWQHASAGDPLCGPGCPVGANYLGICESAAAPDRGRALAGGMRAVIRKQRGEYTGEYSLTGPQGPRWFNVRVSRFEDAGQVRIVVAHEDVTDRKRLEESLRLRADELAQADQRKTEFIAMLGHELRNPLAPLLTCLHLLDQREADPKAQEKARQTMGRQLRHLNHLVEDLLDVSRITHGQVQLHAERLDFARLARTMAEDFRFLLDPAGLTLTVETPETPVWVWADPTRLSQVLANLLDNAAKFTDRGGRVTVTLTPNVGMGQAVLTVRDTGAGIEPSILPHLFEAFAQGDRSLHRAAGGLGLGLAVVKGLVGLHQGQVQVASAGPGQGSEFTVRLPLEAEPAALTAMPAASQAADERLRVLIVEDNRDAADSLQLLLELLGHEVRAAYTGPEGVQRAKEWRPDIVLCDIGLPGLDGYGVAAALRRNPATAKVRAIALTGYGLDEDRRRAGEAGFDHFLVKPASPEDIQRLLVPRKG